MSDLERFFSPRSIAVIGASRDPGSVGHELLRILAENRLRGGFDWRLYAVNPRADSDILGVPTYRSVNEVPGDVDLGVIVTPARYVPSIVEECGLRGIKNLIVISGGFAEVGEEGKRLQDALIRAARRRGMRILGPNCVGVVVPRTGVDTAFLPVEKPFGDGSLESLPRPPPGNISLISQSGAFGVACLDYMAGEGLGLAKFVSYGNKADVDEVDLIGYLADDPETRVIIVYAESIERGREFLEAVRRAVAKKPVVVLKAGRTSAGARAASSHTAALAGSDEVYEAALRQAGAIRVYEVEELFDATKALSMQPPARGRRVAVLTDGGGAGVMATDELESRGASVPRLSGRTLAELERMREEGEIPPISGISNPVDLTGSATDEHFVRSLEVLLGDPGIDGVVVLALHHVPGVTDELPSKLARVAADGGKPVVACDIGQGSYSVAFRDLFDRAGIPASPPPERAARAMVHLIRYGEALARVSPLRSSPTP